MLLITVLTVSVLAGEIDCPGVVKPPPPTTANSITTNIILALIDLSK